jgi:flagellar hook-basal body complex protein FliE
MIDPVSSANSIQSAVRAAATNDTGGAARLRAPDGMGEALAGDGAQKTTFGEMLGDLVRSVDDRTRIAETETRRLMLGESDNIHRSMIAMQESGLAFSLLVEVRNKLVDTYQELMRMPV